MLLTAHWCVDTILLLIIAIFLLYKYIFRNFDYWEKRNISYIEPKPLFGNFYDISTFKTTIGEYLAKLYNSTDEPFFGIFVFNQPHLIIKSPDIIKNILVKDFNYFYDRSIHSPKHEPLTANLLFINKNPDWKTMRKVLTPVFSSGKLKAMFPLIDQIAIEMNKYILKHIDDEVVESKEICAKYSTDVIAKCAFAINAHSFDSENPEFRRIGKLVFDFSLKNAIQQTSYFFLPLFVDLFKLKFIPTEVTEFLSGVFWNAVETREKSNGKGNDLIDCLVNLRKNKEFVESVDFRGPKVVAPASQFFLAGYETTSSTLGFTLYELCIHPHIQHKLRDEIHSSIIKHNGLTYEGLMDMKYLHLCICETLRKYPVLPFLDRVANQDYKIPGTDVIIEKGTPVYIPMFGLHYDPAYFPNPQKYIPERFAEESVNKLSGFCYIPFGEGPRNCIGERFGMLGTKLGVAHIISQFELIRTKETPVPLEFEPKSFILASKVGLPMKFKKFVSEAA